MSAFGHRRRLVPLVVLVVGFVAVVPLPVAADEVTPLWPKRWTANELASFEWEVSEDSSHTVVPSWLRTVMLDVFQTTWNDLSTNNSNGPWFTYFTSSDIDVRFSANISQTAFCGSNWVGCADPTVIPKKIYIRKDPQVFSDPWCDLTMQLGCPDAGRASIHEIGHIGDLGHTTSTVWAESRVQGGPTIWFPFNNTATWDKRTLGRCDEAALQLRYDVEDKAGDYSRCLDHVNNAVQGVGLATTLSAAPTSTSVCNGATVTVSGRLEVAGYASYGELANNGLWGRTVWIDRGSTPNYTSTTVTSGSGNNWSKSFAHSNITYNYVAHYESPSTDGLADSPNRAFSITWHAC